MRAALDRLYDLFQDAPELGSLIDPRAAAGEGLWAVDPDELLAKLDQALQREAAADPAAAVFGAAAAGTAKAAQLLSQPLLAGGDEPAVPGARKAQPGPENVRRAALFRNAGSNWPRYRPRPDRPAP